MNLLLDIIKEKNILSTECSARLFNHSNNLHDATCLLDTDFGKLKIILEISNDVSYDCIIYNYKLNKNKIFKIPINKNLFILSNFIKQNKQFFSTKNQNISFSFFLEIFDILLTNCSKIDFSILKKGIHEFINDEKNIEKNILEQKFDIVKNKKNITYEILNYENEVKKLKKQKLYPFLGIILSLFFITLFILSYLFIHWISYAILIFLIILTVVIGYMKIEDFILDKSYTYSKQYFILDILNKKIEDENENIYRVYDFMSVSDDLKTIKFDIPKNKYKFTKKTCEFKALTSMEEVNAKVNILVQNTSLLQDLKSSKAELSAITGIAAENVPYYQEIKRLKDEINMISKGAENNFENLKIENEKIVERAKTLS